MNPKPKCVFVLGPESTGSKFLAKICSHVLGIHQFGHWDGTAWSDKGGHCVLHRSLPYENPPNFPDVFKWVEEKEPNYELFFVMTTRDITMSQLSRYERWKKPSDTAAKESERAREIMVSVLKSDQKSFLWSYETFMFLKRDYLAQLYAFLDISSDFLPELIDGNAKKVKSADASAP
ncbi:MAG: hypothetical protein ABJN22_12440 [Litorimonas sp.]